MNETRKGNGTRRNSTGGLEELGGSLVDTLLDLLDFLAG